MATPRDLSEKWDSKRYPSNIYELENEFQRKIDAYLDTAAKHNDESNLSKAKSCVPINELSHKAQLHYENVSKGRSQAVIKGKSLDLRDCLLLELIFWFKYSFFKWFNAPNCPECDEHQAMTNIAYINALPEEIFWGGDRVELYECQKCCKKLRFPRYNHPVKLLETRTGRCGEWANCFTLLCRALNFEARFVVDWTDHVWTEVYSEHQRRWLHCDPCENICDAPLLYDVGWGKKLNYVIAFDKYDIQDVTWRYTTNHRQVLQRRNRCREEWLLETIFRVRKQLQSALDSSRRAVFEDRLVFELVEMLQHKVAQENEKFGRISGSLEWRRERGEIGTESKLKPMIYTLTSQEIFNKTFHLKYNVTTDQYVRSSCDNLELNGWQAGAFEQVGLFRKVEEDWNQVYIARTEGTETGEISWKLDCSDTALKVTDIAFKCTHATFENGQVLWTIDDGNKSRIILTDSQSLYKTDEFKDSQILTINAKLSGGTGCNGWQHAQLFRQSTADKNCFSFDLTVSFQ